MERAHCGGPFWVGEVRWASLLIEVRDMLRQIDDGNYRRGVENDVCLFCQRRGHQRTECPTLRNLVVDGQNYVCGKCEAVNHHLTPLCPYPGDYGYANFYQGRR